MTTRITCVYDEGSQPATSLIGAKGTAFVIERDGRKILFNTGMRDRYLIHNMEHLEIDPASIEAVVVSQSNPCDSGALNGFLSMRKDPIDVYCPNGLYGAKGFFSRNVGLTEDNGKKAVFHDLGEWTEVVPGLHITPFIFDEKGYGETFLVIDENRKLGIVSGRCSCGPDAVISKVNEHFDGVIRAFLGPVFLEKKKKPVAVAYAESLEPIQDLYLNHCTGVDGMTNLRVHLGLDGVSDFYVGDTYEL